MARARRASAGRISRRELEEEIEDELEAVSDDDDDYFGSSRDD